MVVVGTTGVTLVLLLEWSQKEGILYGQKSSLKTSLVVFEVATLQHGDQELGRGVLLGSQIVSGDVCSNWMLSCDHNCPVG